jgi:ferredoxin-thioredoxin reductase catalytic subunit
MDEKTIRVELSKLPNGTTIIHGGCKGADKISDYIASKLGFSVVFYRANWQKYGKAAGPIRNQWMLDDNPDLDLVLAFTHDIKKSRGTADMVRRARKAGKKVKIIGDKNMANLGATVKSPYKPIKYANTEAQAKEPAKQLEKETGVKKETDVVKGANDLTASMEKYALSRGFKLNPNQDAVKIVVSGLLENERKHGRRYCPCRVATGNEKGDARSVCPCEWHQKEIELTGSCHCGLFVKG